MCTFVEGKCVMPGIGCCFCRTYNGAHRLLCKSCGNMLHQVDMPNGVNQCIDCGFAYRGELKPCSIDGVEYNGCPNCAVLAMEDAAAAKLNAN